MDAARSEAAEEVRGRMEGERDRALRAQAERLERKSKQVRALGLGMHRGFDLDIQGDHSSCVKPPVDIKTKVPF